MSEEKEMNTKTPPEEEKVSPPTELPLSQTILQSVGVLHPPNPSHTCLGHLSKPPIRYGHDIATVST